MLPVREYVATHVQDVVVATRGRSCSTAHSIAAVTWICGERKRKNTKSHRRDHKRSNRIGVRVTRSENRAFVRFLTLACGIRIPTGHPSIQL